MSSSKSNRKNIMKSIMDPERTLEGSLESMPINSRAKGKAGELELSRVLREHGYDTRRGQQFCGINGDADVTGLPYMHIECKRVEKLNLDAAMAQARIDAREGEMPCVMHRKNREPWKVTMLLDDWIELYREWAAGKELEDGEKENTE